MRWFTSTLLFITALASPAGAQELAAAVSAYRSFGIDDLNGALPLQAEVQVSFPLSDRFAFEPFVTVGSSQLRSGAVEGFYGAQIRQRIARLTTSSAYAFVTYGAAGYYSGYGIDPPISGQFGFGLHKRLSPRMALRPEVVLVTLHVMPIGARFLIGMSIDLAR
jgi:hypothetical protein